MRRTVATLLVVTSPLLIAAPVGAREGRIAAPPAATAPLVAPPAVPGPAATAPVAPGPAATAPAFTAPVTPALTDTAAVVPAPARTATAAVRPVVRAVRTRALAPAALDAAYEAKLRADLCQARAIFCGLDRGGRYPAG